MDLADEIGAALVQDLGAVLLAEIVAIEVEIARLDLGAHCSITEQDSLGEMVEEVAHRLRTYLLGQSGLLRHCAPRNDATGCHCEPSREERAYGTKAKQSRAIWRKSRTYPAPTAAFGASAFGGRRPRIWQIE